MAEKTPSAASFKTQLVRLISQNGTLLFHSPDGHPYATVTIGTHRETMSLSGRAFSDHLVMPVSFALLAIVAVLVRPRREKDGK